MSNEVFDSLFRERADIFRSAFSAFSTEIFFDGETRRLRHAAEYGMFRESIVREFLRFIVPRSLDISSGFILSPMNDVSTQCDIVVFDPRMTPLLQEGDRQRFFPIESVFCMGEVKSTLSRGEFQIALNKLARIKALGERLVHPAILGRQAQPPFNPVNHPYDLAPSILICQKLNFPLENIENEIDALYNPTVLHRHKHNMILSVEDGLLSYVSKEINLPYPRLARVDLKHRFTYPDENPYVHLKFFGSNLFMLTANKTLLYPEFADYLGDLSGGRKRDQAN